jgi:hypothetical protein
VQRAAGLGLRCGLGKLTGSRLHSAPLESSAQVCRLQLDAPAMVHFTITKSGNAVPYTRDSGDGSKRRPTLSHLRLSLSARTACAELDHALLAWLDRCKLQASESMRYLVCVAARGV